MLDLGYRRYKYLQFTRNRGSTIFIQTTTKNLLYRVESQITVD